MEINPLDAPGQRRLGTPRTVDALEYAAARLPDVQALRLALRTRGEGGAGKTNERGSAEVTLVQLSPIIQKTFYNFP